MSVRDLHSVSTDLAADLPDVLPVLPLTGVILLPRGRLPLNIFEPRYLALVDQAMGQGRTLGMIQPTGDDANEVLSPLYNIGCMGRITSFSETEDGRYLISLIGVSRFKIGEELPMQNGYRRVRPVWAEFAHDLGGEDAATKLDRNRLLAALRDYFKAQGITANWEAIQQTTDENLVVSLTMVCPFEPNEKQALLEATTLAERARMLLTLLEMAALDKREIESARH